MRSAAPRRPTSHLARKIGGLLLLAFLYLSNAGHEESGCCSEDHHGGLPAKDMPFTKMRGPNVGPLEGTDTMGTCPTEEKGKAACYGAFLVHCSDDGEPHAVDCAKKLGTTMCIETATLAECL